MSALWHSLAPLGLVHMVRPERYHWRNKNLLQGPLALAPLNQLTRPGRYQRLILNRAFDTGGITDPISFRSFQINP